MTEGFIGTRIATPSKECVQLCIRSLVDILYRARKRGKMSRQVLLLLFLHTASITCGDRDCVDIELHEVLATPHQYHRHGRP